MLKHLNLKNFVLVESLEIDFGSGLSTVTGESGAGKSILLAALGLILGERANTEAIRPGTQKADVNAEFDLGNLAPVRALLAEAELLEDDPNQCLIRRVISTQGRSRAYVNGVPVTTQFLRSMGDLLVDVHGQNEHILLASKQVQLQLLDDYTGTQPDADKVSALYRTWQQQLTRIEELRQTLEAATDKKELLTYQLEELDDFALGDDEFGQLERDHRRLSQAQDTLATLQSSLSALDELDSLRQSTRQIETIDDNQADLVSAQANLQAALGLLDDANKDLSRYQDQVVVDPHALQQTKTRLNVAQDLARKHRVQVQALPSHTQQLREELLAIDANRSDFDELQQNVAAAEQKFNKAAKTLSNKRKKAAPKFSSAVGHYMQQLGITNGSFDIEFTQSQGEMGIDRVEFMVATNPDFPAGPLTQIASGGEQTRISLSIQIVAAQNSALPCLVLDEADVGVGGTTADTVGRILRTLAKHTQVICVTHAPQVAALGNHHYRVLKEGNHTAIHQLDQDSRVEELARMLAGADINDKTRDYAQSLLSAADD